MASDLELFGNSRLSSPYVLSVYAALIEKGLPFDLTLLDLEKGEQNRPDFVACSITNRVPTLRHQTQSHGQRWISESLAILEYLEEAFPAPRYARLFPEDLLERARVRMVMGLLRSDFLPIREERSTETIFYGVPVQPLSSKAQAARERLLRIAAAVLEGRSSIASSFSIADIDLATMLQRLVANGDAVPDPLAQYARSVWQRPAVLKWLELTRASKR